MLIKRTRRSAMSLIEVLIAIYIFGVGILIVMRMILSNITWLYDIKTKDTAVGLAKEGMDIMYHIRDSNTTKGMNRNCAFISASEPYTCTQYLLTSTSGSRYTISWTLTGLYTLSNWTSTGDAQLRYHVGNITVVGGTQLSGFWYTHASGGNASPTLFYRWIDITPVNQYTMYTGYVIQVRSTVQYQKGGRAEKVILEGILGDIR